MEQDILNAANRAAITNLPAIMGLRAEQEQKIAVEVDRLTTDLLREVYRLGFEAGYKSAGDRK